MGEKLKKIYSSLSEIQKELERRQNDPVLLEKIEDLFKSYPKPFPFTETIAALSRSIATPNKELEYFIDLADLVGLEPVVLEYNGKFVAKNKEKYFLCLPHFCFDNEKRLYRKKRIVNFNVSEGRLIHDVKTKSGNNLKEIHRVFLEKSSLKKKPSVVDITEWFNTVRQKEDGYYFYFFSLFIIHGVLFENYLSDDPSEKAFFEEKIWPSFEAVHSFFGVKPLIFPLLPITHENRSEWLYYPKELEEVLQ